MRKIYALSILIAINLFSLEASAGSKTHYTLDTSPVVVLPVRWMEFTATYGSQAAILRWSTLHEQGIREFGIERSINNKDFESIGSTLASGNSTSFKEYSFTDRFMAPGNNYYRIMSIDENGFKTISLIRKVNNAGHKFIYPVEISKIYTSGRYVLLTASMHHRQYAEVIFYTRAGRRVLSKTIHADSNSIPVDLLKPGLYYVSTGYQTFAIVLSK